MKLSFQPAKPNLPNILTDPQEVATALAALDLAQEDLATAVAAARTAGLDWTPDHPSTARGTSVHVAAVAELRRVLRRKRWRIQDEQNQPLAFHPTREFAVTVANGDIATGDPDATPTTRASKGRRTRQAVEQNQLQGTFSEISSAFDPPQRETWILLVRTGADGNLVRAELSRPAGFDKQGRVAVWTSRLMLTDLLGYASSVQLSTPPQDWGYPERIDVPVRSKTEWDTPALSIPADSPSPDSAEE